MLDIATQEKYRNAWKAVSSEFQEGYCVSERGLQSALASALKAQFPEMAVVIEPRWIIESIAYVPDIVLVNDMKISDVFELKFVPHSYVVFESDMKKLALFSDCSHIGFPVRLNPSTGIWTNDKGTLHDECQFHFVAVAQADAAAVCTESLTSKVPLSGTGRLHHWYGSVGAKKGGKWDISFSI